MVARTRWTGLLKQPGLAGSPASHSGCKDATEYSTWPRSIGLGRARPNLIRRFLPPTASCRLHLSRAAELVRPDPASRPSWTKAAKVH